jgi:hypothetical protein
MSKKYLAFIKTKWFLVVACLLVGALVVMGIRFFTYKPEESVHYHANFALFVNGQRQEFQEDHYYSEEEMCTAETEVTPVERAHMHDHINNVVHIEDQAVTWGQFFTNLGWTLGPDMIEAPDGTIYPSATNRQLHIMLNGQDYTGLGSIANFVIKDLDRLLVSYGDADKSSLSAQYAAVPSTAGHYDTAPDPASCGAGRKSGSLRERFMHIF